MKNNTFLKIIVVILTIFTFLSLASCTTSTTYMKYAEWSMDEDGETLKRVGVDGESTKFVLVGMDYNISLVGDLYAYMSFVEDPYAGLLACYAPAEDSPVVFVGSGNGYKERSLVYIYAEEGCAEAEEYAAFLRGESERYTAYLPDRSKEGVFSPEELALLRSPLSDAENGVLIEVKSLRGKVISEILAYSADRRLARLEGAIYELDAEKYFVDYTALDNSYFDAEGNFSYQRGSVVAERLTGEKKETVETVMRRTVSVSQKISLEEGRYEQQTQQATPAESAVTLVVMTVIVGLCIPLLPIGYVAVYALTEKKRALALGRPCEKIPAPLWVMLAGGALWFVSALTLLFIFATV